MNIINGGKLADNNVDFQEFMRIHATVLYFTAAERLLTGLYLTLPFL